MPAGLIFHANIVMPVLNLFMASSFVQVAWGRIAALVQGRVFHYPALPVAYVHGSHFIGVVSLTHPRNYTNPEKGGGGVGRCCGVHCIIVCTRTDLILPFLARR
jgi:hypothetical protein